MLYIRNLPFAAAAMISFSAACASAQLYWNGETTGDGAGWSDEWDLVTDNWNTDNYSMGTQTIWVEGEDAIFDTVGGTVNLLAAPTAGSITVLDPYTFHGDDGAGTATMRNLTTTLFDVDGWGELILDYVAPYGEGGAVVRKTGDGPMTLRANMPGGNINFTVDEGIVYASAKQGASWWGDGLLNGQWTVNQNGTVELQGAHMIDYYGQTININGGLFRSNREQYMGTINFGDGGTLEQTGSSDWRLRGQVNVAASDTTARFAGANGDINMINNITFNVEDGSVADDLVVENEIRGGARTLTKTGAGRMVAEGAMNYTSGTVIQAGTLVVSNSLENTGLLTLGGGKLEINGQATAEAVNYFGAGSLGNGGAFINMTDDPATLTGVETPYYVLNSGIGGDTTWVYEGVFNVSAGEAGTWSFVENYDDGALVIIDGTVVISNDVWNAATTGTYAMDEGNHSIELRVGNAGGGAGPLAGWEQKGIAFAKSDTGGSTTAGDYLSFILDNIGMLVYSSVYAHDVALDGILLSGNSSIEVLGSGAATILTKSLNAAGDTSGAGQFALDLYGADIVVDTATADSTFNGRIVNGGDLIKGGTNTFAIAGANQDIGDIQVDAGTLQFDGTLAGSSTITVKGDNLFVGEIVPGVLSGTGTVDSILVEAGGELAPGNSIGTLSASGDVDLDGLLVIELDGDSGLADLLAVAGTLDIGDGEVDFSILSALDDSAYVFASYGTLLGGTFQNVGDQPEGYYIDYNFNDANQIALVIPEPATTVLSLLGALLICWQRRRAIRGF
jgi:autotransporter-associated beta strand protein